MFPVLTLNPLQGDWARSPKVDGERAITEPIQPDKAGDPCERPNILRSFSMSFGEPKSKISK